MKNEIERICDMENCGNLAFAETEFDEMICTECAEKLVEDDMCDWEDFEKTFFVK